MLLLHLFFQVRLHINMDKDHTLNTVEMGTYSSAGSFFGISGTRNYTYAMQGGNELSHSSVLETLHSFTNQTRYFFIYFFESEKNLGKEQKQKRLMVLLINLLRTFEKFWSFKSFTTKDLGRKETPLEFRTNKGFRFLFCKKWCL